MVHTHLQTVDATAPAAATDDFKLIKGIGPSIEKRLHANGILTFAHLAALSPDDVAALVTDIAGLSAQRIAQLNWIDQAKEWATKQTTDIPSDDIVARQQYATFTVELLLAEGKEVRRTRVVHVQSGNENSWAGWDEQRLLGSITQHVETHPQPGATTRLDDVEPALMDSADERSVRHAQAEMPEPLSDLQLTVGDLLISQVPADEYAHGSVNRMRVQVDFALSGSDVDTLAARQTTYFVRILAHELETGKEVVWVTEHQPLRAGVVDYATTIDCELPEVGRYQLLGLVLLSNDNTVGVTFGPVLTVTP